MVYYLWISSIKGVYDTVWKSKLIHKLATKHISEYILRCFSDFLDQLLINIQYDTAQSIFSILHTGLLKGSVSSCLMFDVYIDGLVHSLIDDDITEFMHADYHEHLALRTRQKRNWKFPWITSCTNSRCLENNIIVNREKTKFRIFLIAPPIITTIFNL